jgi:hypothetical protein
MGGAMMRHEFDIFERYLDGSSIWRATVSGRYEAQRKMQEFAEHSENAFFAIDVKAGRHFPHDISTGDSRRLENAKAMSG